ncbi:DUF805 domain-containing protein [Chitinimonas sp.]|uniref:DUF805 domain-containing protein n=1 Tax=Chitinimonas sp. TaxID=1934313 RepID=UPI002F931495
MTSTVPQANVYASSSAAGNPMQGDETYQPQFLSLSGRIGRVRYLAYCCALTLIWAVAFGIVAVIGAVLKSPVLMGIGMVVLYIPLIVVQLGFGRRRLNDLDQSGWWLLLNFVPLANLGLAIYMLFFPGTKGSNRFGPEPVANTAGVIVLACIIPVFVFLGGILAAIAIPQYAEYQKRAKAKAAQQQGVPALPDAAEAPAPVPATNP